MTSSKLSSLTSLMSKCVNVQSEEEVVCDGRCFFVQENNTYYVYTPLTADCSKFRKQKFVRNNTRVTIYDSNDYECVTNEVFNFKKRCTPVSSGTPSKNTNWTKHIPLVLLILTCTFIFVIPSFQTSGKKKRLQNKLNLDRTQTP